MATTPPKKSAFRPAHRGVPRPTVRATEDETGEVVIETVAPAEEAPIVDIEGSTDKPSLRKVGEPEETEKVARPSAADLYRRFDSASSLFEVSDVPSQMKAYPEGTRIFYRPYTFDEVSFFSSSKITDDLAIMKILEGIETIGIDKADLTLMDYYFIALLRKLSSFNTMKFNLKFPAFGREQSAQITFEDIVFEDLEVDALPLVATFEDTELHFVPITVGRYVDLVLQGTEENISHNLAMCVTNVDFDEALPIISKAMGDDIAVLELIDSHLTHSLAPVKCPALRVVPNPDYDSDSQTDDLNPLTLIEKEVIDVHLGHPSTLIAPFREHEFDPRSRISFGLKGSS